MRLSVLLAALLVGTLGGCTSEEENPPATRPQVGDPCSIELQAFCGEVEGQVLVCRNGAYQDGGACPAGYVCQSYADSGFVACSAGGGQFVSIGFEGGPCPNELFPEGGTGSRHCTADGQRYVVCGSGNILVDECAPGFSFDCFAADAAAQDAIDLTCLPAGARTCDQQGVYVCDGRQTAYQCNGQVYEQALECPSLQTCIESTSKDQFFCGDPNSDFYIAYAQLGDPCAAEASAVCNFDQSKVLICELGTWIQFLDCGGSSLKCQRDASTNTTGCE